MKLKLTPAYKEIINVLETRPLYPYVFKPSEQESDIHIDPSEVHIRCFNFPEGMSKTFSYMPLLSEVNFAV